MEFSIIGINRSKYGVLLIENLVKASLMPKYVIIEDNNPNCLAASTYFIDTCQLPKMPQEPLDWGILDIVEENLVNTCIKLNIPFLMVPDHNSRYTAKILAYNNIDVLLITEGPIIRGPIIYMPRICVMNIHAAPLPGYRGNWTTRLALYNDEPPIITSHVVTPWVDEGPIIKKMRYEISEGDTLEDIDAKAMMEAVNLAVCSLVCIKGRSFTLKKQLLWEGITYKGKKINSYLQTAMPKELQEELTCRLEQREYGFYGS